MGKITYGIYLLIIITFISYILVYDVHAKIKQRYTMPLSNKKYIKPYIINNFFNPIFIIFCIIFIFSAYFIDYLYIYNSNIINLLIEHIDYLVEIKNLLIPMLITSLFITYAIKKDYYIFFDINDVLKSYSIGIKLLSIFSFEILTWFSKIISLYYQNIIIIFFTLWICVLSVSLSSYCLFIFVKIQICHTFSEYKLINRIYINYHIPYSSFPLLNNQGYKNGFEYLIKLYINNYRKYFRKIFKKYVHNKNIDINLNFKFISIEQASTNKNYILNFRVILTFIMPIIITTMLSFSYDQRDYSPPILLLKTLIYRELIVITLSSLVLFLLISYSRKIRLRFFNFFLGSWGYHLVLNNNTKIYHSSDGFNFLAPKIKKFIINIKNIITLYRISLVNNTQYILLESLKKSIPNNAYWYDILPLYICHLLDYNYNKSINTTKSLAGFFNEKNFDFEQNEVILYEFTIAFLEDLKRNSTDYKNYFSLDSIDEFNNILKNKRVKVQVKKKKHHKKATE